MSTLNSASTPADVNVIITKNLDENVFNFLYGEATGSLLFLSSVYRPHISFAVNLLSRSVNNPHQQHVNAVKPVSTCTCRYLIAPKICL